MLHQLFWLNNEGSWRAFAVGRAAPQLGRFTEELVPRTADWRQREEPQCAETAASDEVWDEMP